ncbi:DNA mismatch repair protein MutS [Mucilaginibacter corticis]|uniref:DNA mismatch repair protein MutS n=1 Tax=Mucilaginibacter corticis TaxID=2597670 RepID=A0A556MKK4_9SPHI|nr:DNA mismatch repair protein MutS [Mucilaginibacter corticis]TSJ40436.1 DNA mismatch repair protein MutS [Mucilaginibacter corticis]
MENDIIDHYTNNAQQASQQADKFKKLVDTYSLMRLGIFAALVVAIYFGAVNDNFSIVAVSFVILLFVFASLISRQSAYERKRKYFKDLTLINNNEIASIQTRGNIYSNGSAFGNEKHFYTSDLDIFGNMSLFQLMNRAATAPGIAKLASWLSAPAKKEVILQRQQAVEEIANKNQWRLEIQTLLLFANKPDANQLQGLFAFLHTPLTLPGEKLLVNYINIAPYLLLAAFVAGYFTPVFTLIGIGLALANMTIVMSQGGYIAKSSAIADRISKDLAGYAAVFAKIEQEDWHAPYNKALTQKIKENQTSKNIAELSKLINKMSYNLIMVVNFVLNVLLLWALKQAIAIENWKRNNHESLEDAFEVIAEFEALSGIAGLKFNYPQWSNPQIEDSETYTIVAQNMAHPLINSKNRVTNDYELTDTFKIDIITGSNMAGKSTFLRTIGINTVLALCGAPVCADSMRVSVMTMVSYMRIKDSLNESTSTFKAELDRLQMLLAAVEKEYKVFFLIDEMLRGTNSVDKYLGSKAVIEQLIAKKGVGMVATHDLEIAKLETAYPDYVRNFYFDIQVKDGEMLFDYKMKHGECKTFNASLLLRQIGIDVGA